MNHELKILDKYFNEVKNGHKKFELRKNDRNYNIGDILILNEIDKNGNKTGRTLKRKIMYILQSCPPNMGL